MAESPRPALTQPLSGGEFAHWYWQKADLMVFARELGIRTTGSKNTLTARNVAALEGDHFTEPELGNTSSGPQLSGVLTPSTVIPAGLRCSRARRFLHCGE